MRLPGIAVLMFSLANCLIAPIGLAYLVSDPTIVYVGWMAIIFLEAILLLKGKTHVVAALTAGLAMHFYTFRSVVLGVQSLVMDISMYDIVHTVDLFEFNTMFVFILHIAVLVVFILLVPPDAAKSIIANKTLINTLSIMMIVFMTFLIYNAKMFTLRDEYDFLAMQQILVPLVLLGSFYLMLILMLRLVMMDKYKQVILELENKIDKDKALANALFNYADVVIEFNATTDAVNNFLISSSEVYTDSSLTFTTVIESQLLNVHPEDTKHVLNMSSHYVKTAYASGIIELICDYRAYAMVQTDKGMMGFKDEEYLWHRMKINSSLDDSSNEVISICTIDEIQAEKEEELRLRHKTETDTLTGAYNKEAVKAYVSKLMENGGHGTLFMFDVDNFKGINDNMGHAYGDEVLKETYLNILKLFRSHDIVGRFGGDEFIVFMSGDFSRNLLSVKAQAICDTVEKLHEADNGVKIRITSSIGIASCPRDAVTYDELFNAADHAMYVSKNKGKSTYTFYDSTMQDFKPQINIRQN